jgi:hypothetical protein
MVVLPEVVTEVGLKVAVVFPFSGSETVVSGRISYRV